jgi:hypothetical protein
MMADPNSTNGNMLAQFTITEPARVQSAATYVSAFLLPTS